VTEVLFDSLQSRSEAPRAAYLNLAEGEEPGLHELPDLARLAELLEAGMAHDMARIAAGEPLPALGEGSVCDWCEVRGLCRKDFWHE
jgi:ATP-dependent helicase/nuclease subunit B